MGRCVRGEVPVSVVNASVREPSLGLPVNAITSVVIGTLVGKSVEVCFSL